MIWWMATNRFCRCRLRGVGRRHWFRRCILLVIGFERKSPSGCNGYFVEFQARVTLALALLMCVTVKGRVDQVTVCACNLRRREPFLAGSVFFFCVTQTSLSELTNIGSVGGSAG